MGIEILNFLRENTNTVLDNIFLFFTEIGGDVAATLFIAIIMWCFNKKFGQLIAFSGFFSFSINGIIKDIFKLPRPMTMGVKANETAAKKVLTGYGGYSYSFPSGHAQTSATIATSLCRYYKDKRWLYIAGAVLVFLIGFSRVFLGVHYPIDVLAGWLLGIVVSLAAYKLFNKFYDKRTLLYLIAALIMLPAAFFWSEDTAKSLGGLIGFALGNMFEEKFVNYTIKGTGRKKLVLRLFLGIAILLGVRGGLAAIFPDEIIILHYVRYAAVMFTATGIYPYVFTKLKF